MTMPETSFKNAVIVNHQVLHADVLAAGGIEDYLEYVLRENDPERRLELDWEPTRQDILLETAKAARTAADDAFDYYSRSGRFDGRREDLPLTAGERSGICWDANGLADPHRVKAEVLASGSNVVRSIVSVPREWAPDFGLTTKEAWQTLIRSSWPDVVGTWGNIPPAYQRWAAFYHVDNAKNLHVHIITWDSSGYFFSNDRNIPHSRIEPSTEALRKRAYERFSLERSLTKGSIRQEAVDLARRLSATPELKSLRERAVEAMPESGIGRVGYASASLDARAAANLAVMQMASESPRMAELSARWDGLVERGADILGKHGADRASYIDAERADLRKRLATAFLKEAAKGNVPWARDAGLSALRRAAAEKVLAGVSREAVASQAASLKASGERNPKAALGACYGAAAEGAAKEAVEGFARQVVNYAERCEGHPLEDNQKERLAKRAAHAVVALAALRTEAAVGARAAGLLAESDVRKARCVLAALRRNPAAAVSLLGPVKASEVERDMAAVRSALRSTGKPDAAALRRISDAIASTPEVTASIESSVELGCGMTAREATVSRRSAIEEAAAAIAARGLSTASGNGLSAGVSAVEAVVRFALSPASENRRTRFSMDDLRPKREGHARRGDGAART